MAKIRIHEDDYDFIRADFLRRVHDDITAGTSKEKKIKIITTNTPTPAVADHEDHPVRDRPPVPLIQEVPVLDDDPGQGDRPRETLRERYRRLLRELSERKGT